MKVLIIDDSPTESHVAKGFLTRNGFDVILADNAEQGLKLAEHESPDAILMDIVMPGMNGFQATRHLTKNEQTANIPVIILSSKNASTDKMWGMRQGAIDYLTKPVNEKELVNRLRNLV